MQTSCSFCVPERKWLRQDIILHTPDLLDPRVFSGAQTMPLALRPASLQGKRLLLFDNGKLHHQYSYAAVIFRTVTQRLQTQYGIQQCRRFRRDLLSIQDKSLRSLAKDIVQTGIDAALLALCDAGVTAYTVVLAWELERQGIPTVTLCAGQCIYLAATMTSVVMPGLPLSQLNIQRLPSGGYCSRNGLGDRGNR